MKLAVTISTDTSCNAIQNKWSYMQVERNGKISLTWTWSELQLEGENIGSALLCPHPRQSYAVPILILALLLVASRHQGGLYKNQACAQMQLSPLWKGPAWNVLSCHFLYILSTSIMKDLHAICSTHASSKCRPPHKSKPWELKGTIVKVVHNNQGVNLERHEEKTDDVSWWSKSGGLSM